MTINAQNLLLQEPFDTLAAAQGWSRVQYEGVEFTPPVGSMWFAVQIRVSEGEQATFGSPGANDFRRRGVVIVQVHTPFGEGTKANEDACQLIVAAYRAADVDGITFRRVHDQQIGRIRADFVQMVRVEFETNERA